MDKPTIPFKGASVGTNPWRVDGVWLVTGSAKFTDDIFLKEMLHAKILGSPDAHARILDIDTTEAKKLPRMVIVLPPSIAVYQRRFACRCCEPGFRAATSRREFAERRLPARRAVERLGLCHASFSPSPQSRRQQSAKTLVRLGRFDRWRCRSDIPCRGHIACQTLTVCVPLCIRARNQLAAGTATKGFCCAYSAKLLSTFGLICHLRSVPSDGSLCERSLRRIGVRNRLTADVTINCAGSQRLRVFSLRHNSGAPLQNPKTLSLPVAIPCRPRCRRCEPWVLAATSLSTIATQQRIRALFSVGLRESPFDCTAHCAPSRMLRVVASAPP